MIHERNDDMPIYMKWIMTFINRIGFPIVVCGWLAYQQFTMGKETVNALHEFKEVMIQVKDSLDAQNQILRRRSKDD